jgi:hypothetical protein
MSPGIVPVRSLKKNTSVSSLLRSPKLVEMVPWKLLIPRFTNFNEVPNMYISGGISPFSWLFPTSSVAKVSDMISPGKVPVNVLFFAEKELRDGKSPSPVGNVPVSLLSERSMFSKFSETV